MRPAFSLEDGAAPLAAAFASVERVDCPPSHVVVDADALADYVASVGDHYEDEVGVPWSAVVAHVRDLAGAAVARAGRCGSAPRPATSSAAESKDGHGPPPPSQDILRCATVRRRHHRCALRDLAVLEAEPAPA